MDKICLNTYMYTSSSIGSVLQLVVLVYRHYFGTGYSGIQCVVKESNFLQEVRRHVAVDFTQYVPYEQITEYLKELSEENRCELINLGKSEENREILAVRIGSADARAVIIESGIHAREWIAPMTALYTIAQISLEPDMVDNIQWIIIPILNPDGYQYSWTNIKNRLWRKNRSKLKLPDCIGVDINRNFGFQWGGVHSSEDPCKEDYRGNGPWSEPESNVIKELISQLGTKCILYLSLHNYLQSIMYPWGYTKQPPEDANELVHLATKAQAAIRNKYGTRYRVGQSSSIDRLTPGCSIDWAKAEGNIQYCYSIELPSPTYRFLVPPHYLLKIASEYYEAIKVFKHSIRSGRI